MDESISVQRSRVVAMRCDNLILAHSSACRCGAESRTALDGTGRLASVWAVSIVIVFWSAWTAWTAALLFRKEDSIEQDAQSAVRRGEGSKLIPSPWSSLWLCEMRCNTCASCMATGAGRPRSSVSDYVDDGGRGSRIEGSISVLARALCVHDRMHEINIIDMSVCYEVG